MKLNEFYVAVDGNYEDAMERLQNEMFVVKFLRMLPRDGSMMLLEKAMADGRANDAFRAVQHDFLCAWDNSRRHHPPAGP